MNLHEDVVLKNIKKEFAAMSDAQLQAFIDRDRSEGVSEALIAIPLAEQRRRQAR